jgi:hypothetical protein
MNDTMILARLNSEVAACDKPINPQMLAAYISFLVQLQYYD